MLLFPDGLRFVNDLQRGDGQAQMLLDAAAGCYYGILQLDSYSPAATKPATM